ncbi:MAG: hypothetical protein M3383_07405 [Actinomycetota bacterium]|nr:hypothetical protein [Actinomycetota bacterium]
MHVNRRRALTATAIAAVAGLGSGIAIGLIDDDDVEPTAREAGSDQPPALEPQPGPSPRPGGGKEGSGTIRVGEKLPPPESDPQGLEPGPSGPLPASQAERAVAGAARAYVQALDLRSGSGVCRSFAPGALDSLEFPERRAGCATTVESSLGYRDKRGLPVWEHSEMTDAISASVDGDTARVVATIFTRYADVREPSIEDDVMYLTRSGGRWLLAKPSATIHRAIGIADIPPSVLAPP